MCTPMAALRSSRMVSCAPAIASRSPKPKLLEPGQIYELHLDLWATSNVFKAGLASVWSGKLQLPTL